MTFVYGLLPFFQTFRHPIVQDGRQVTMEHLFMGWSWQAFWWAALLRTIIMTEGVSQKMIWNIFNTFGIRGCFPHHQHQVICFGFLLVLTPANWEELLRRLVRYLTEKLNWTIFKRLLWAMHRRMKQCSVSFVSQVVRREKRSGSTYFAMFKSSWWAVLCEMSLVQFWFWDLAWFELFLLNLRD